MQFIDTVNISVISGNGGNTIVNFRKKRGIYQRLYVSYGGDGGNVWLVTDTNLNTLVDFFYKKSFYAENGEDGRSRGCRGKSGKSVFIRVPQGTRVYDKHTDTIIGDLIYKNQRLLLACGGVHGVLDSKMRYINEGFVFSPSTGGRFTKKIVGKHGEKRDIRLELLLLADVGVLGLPNTGKSTFVRFVSGAKTKIADYPFTTLVPYLGVVRLGKDSFVIADIPGLIKGASFGVGLGVSFLKHLERCRMLLHIVDIFEERYFDILENIRIIINELSAFNTKLINKPIWLVFNKVDLLEDIKEAKRRVGYLVDILKWKKEYYLISSKTGYGVKKLCHDLMTFIKFD